MADNTSSIAGLFMSPEIYQQQRQDEFLNKAAAMAKLDPSQLANVYAMQGGFGAGNVLGNVLGVQDPMLQQLSMRNQLASQFDTSSAEGWTNLSNALRQKGDLAGSFEAAQKAMAARKAEADIQAKLAEKLTEQQRNAAALADSQHQRGTPDWQTTYKTELARLTAGNKGANIKEIGVAEGSREPVYFDVATDTQFILKSDPKTGQQTRVPFNGGVDRTTSKSTINIPAAEKAFDVKLAELDAKTVDDARKMRDTAVSSMKSLNQLASLPSEALISGEFASGRVGATNLLATLGLASEADVNRLSKSQQYQKVAGDVVLQTLGGKLGAGFSNEDRKFIQSLVPQLETNPEARRQLIQFMQQKNQDIVAETTRLENYARDKKGLKGFEYKIPIAVSPSKGSAASSLSVEELKRIAGVK